VAIFFYNIEEVFRKNLKWILKFFSKKFVNSKKGSNIGKPKNWLTSFWFANKTIANGIF
jgi:hypothetical protein